MIDKMIDILTPAGIGDIYWLLMKLQNTGEKFHIKTPPGESLQALRSKFLLHLDGVVKTSASGLPYNVLKERAKAFNYKTTLRQMFLECNTHLENGGRIEDYLPAFKTEFKLKWNITKEEEEKAKTYIKENKKNIVIYTSSIANNNSWSTGNWQAENWLSIIRELRKIENINIIWIGASYDADTLNIIKTDDKCIDENAGVIVSLLRLCDGFISYQSGLSIISICEEIPTAMLYFRKLEKMIYTFCPKTSIKNDNLYKPLFFDSTPAPEIGLWARNLKSKKQKKENIFAEKSGEN